MLSSSSMPSMKAPSERIRGKIGVIDESRSGVSCVLRLSERHQGSAVDPHVGTVQNVGDQIRIPHILWILMP